MTSRSPFTLEERLRHAMLMEYLTVRRLREDARKATRRADETDAHQAENDRIRAASDPYHRASSLLPGRWDRQHAERIRAQADGATDVVTRMHDVLKGSY